MLIVSVQIHPSGNALRAREIGRMMLGNVSQLSEISKYVGAAREGQNALTQTPPVEAYLTIKRHRRSQSVWALVATAARQASHKIKIGDVAPWS